MLRRVLVWGLVAGSVATMAFVGPAEARPAAQSTSCSALLGALFNPGLTLTQRNQRITLRGNLSDCSGGGVSTGSVSGSGSGFLSCTAGTATGNANITWNTAETSQISLSLDIATGSFSGSVFGGKFVGEDVSGNLTVTPIAGNCIITPVTKAKATGSVSL